MDVDAAISELETLISAIQPNTTVIGMSVGGGGAVNVQVTGAGGSQTGIQNVVNYHGGANDQAVEALRQAVIALRMGKVEQAKPWLQRALEFASDVAKPAIVAIIAGLSNSL